MIHVLLAALQIAWSGAGYPKNAKTAVPVVVAEPVMGRASRGPVVVRAIYDGSTVPAEWNVTPFDAINLDANQGTSYSEAAAAAYIAPTLYRGPATLHATYGSATGSLAAFVYGSMGIACYLSFPNGARFDEDGVARPSGTPRDSDIYVTGPENKPSMRAWYGCSGAFMSPSARSFALHVPFGGTVLRYKSGVYVGDVRVSDWRDDFTIAPALNRGDVLLFRTHDGRIVKMVNDPPEQLTTSGPYLVGPYKGGEFWDYLTYHPLKKPSHAIFGRH